jgi:Uncharacterised nucleotidyltransferase
VPAFGPGRHQAGPGGPVTLGGISAEGRLRLARASWGPDPAAARMLLDARLNWPHLIERAFRHGLASLLYVTLRTATRAGSAGPPDAILARLRELYDRHAARHTARVAKLAVIGVALERARIPVIVLKGAALGSAV